MPDDNVKLMETSEYARVERTDGEFVHVHIQVCGVWRCLAKVLITPPDTRGTAVAGLWAMFGRVLRPPEHRVVEDADCAICRANARPG